MKLENKEMVLVRWLWGETKKAKHLMSMNWLQMLTGLIISSQKSTISSPPLKVNQLEVFAVCISRGLNFQSYFLLRREWPSALTTHRVESWDTFMWTLGSVKLVQRGKFWSRNAWKIIMSVWVSFSFVMTNEILGI